MSSNTTNISNLRTSELLEFPVHLPPLPEQRRIAALLDKADRLRRLRRYALEVSETYLQSVFLEMFGDFANDQRTWPIIELDSVAEIASGVTKGQNYNGKQTIEVPYLRVANVQDGYLDLSEIKTIRVPPSEAEQLRLRHGDVLMTEGGDFDKLGRGAVWRDEIPGCIHQNHVFRVRLAPNKVRPEYFESLLLTRYAKGYFLAASKQTTNLATINMTQLKGLPTPAPSLKLQDQFATTYRKNERFRAQQREALRQAEHLFQTLLHRAFAGEV
jgi:type I restriction enzyme S subunit